MLEPTKKNHINVTIAWLFPGQLESDISNTGSWNNMNTLFQVHYIETIFKLPLFFGVIF